MVSVPKKRAVMLECNPCTHAIRFGIFSQRWQAKRKLAFSCVVSLCSDVITKLVLVVDISHSLDGWLVSFKGTVSDF